MYNLKVTLYALKNPKLTLKPPKNESKIDKVDKQGHGDGDVRY